jgi:replicative DNA helicase
VTDTDQDAYRPATPGSASPPHDIAAERAAIAAMIDDEQCLARGSQLLSPADFYLNAHATLFAAAVDLMGGGHPTNHLALITHLADRGDLDRVGGAPAVIELLHEAFPSAFGYHANVVLDRAEERRWLAHAVKVQQVLAQPGTTRERRAVIETSFDSVQVRRSAGRGRWAADILEPAIDQMVSAFEGTATARTVPTGYRDLDRLLGGGFHAGQLVIIAGRPGLGKSTAASDVARNAAFRNSMTSMFVSLEMSDIELMLRWISAETGIPFHLIRSGNLSDDQWHQVGSLVDLFAENRMIVFDEPDMYLPQIRAEARRLRHRNDLRLVVVDYIQLMSAPKRQESRQQEVSDLSRGLKLLAKEIACPVVGLAQLNRGPELRADKRPNLADLRESGSLEQDSDVVILLHNPATGDSDQARASEGLMEFIVAKHRNGKTGSITVANRTHVAQFSDLHL